MYCNHCGKANPDDARVCAYCGAVVATGPVERRLIRRRSEKRIAGVAAGVANYFGWNITAVRVVWLLLLLFAGTGLLLYIILWAVMPLED
jgi:phage shock protein PspC (stress-responsive transcriptional regulator)